MTSYKQIQEVVKDKHGWVPKTCWIAHVKELNGLPIRNAPNRRSTERMVPCPPGKRKAIEDAMRTFGML